MNSNYVRQVMKNANPGAIWNKNNLAYILLSDFQILQPQKKWKIFIFFYS